MRADRSTIILRHMVFKNNQAIGGNTNSEYGGAGVGGGIALRAGLAGSSLLDVTFEGNKALGGSGVQRGGFGIGGGIYTFESGMLGSQLIFRNNRAMGGSANGSGTCSTGNNADGQGGGAAFHHNSTITLDRIIVEGNEALGGNAPNGQGGGAFGGGLWSEKGVSIQITDLTVHDNQAVGGNGKNAYSGGSVSFGGGLGLHTSDVFITQASIINNRSAGGNGVIRSGSGNGGGIALIRTEGDTRATIANTVVANNRALMGTGDVSGGGGGGIYMRGAQATVWHSTLAQNEIGSSMQGSAMVLLSSTLPATANLSYSIVAQHDEPSKANALHIQPGNTVNLQTDLFSDNSINYGGGGAVNGVATILSGPVVFRSPGYPDYDYHIQESSAARNAAAGSSERTDLEGDLRDSQPDIGADEYLTPRIASISVVPTAEGSVRVSWATEGGTIERYEVVVFCPRGASDPNEVKCESVLDVGSAQQLQLTGLTQDVTYTVEIRAFDSIGTAIDAQRATFIPIEPDLNFLPVLTGG
jgi:hypothetical protein